jgi:hypothetical protein
MTTTTPRIHCPPAIWVSLFAGVLALAGACGTGALGQSRLLRGPGSGLGSEGARSYPPIAAGALITPTIDLHIQGSGGVSMGLFSARPEVVEARGHRLIGGAPGVSAVLITADNGTVLDFIHLWVVAPTRIALQLLTPDRQPLGPLEDTIELLVGDSLYLAPQIYARQQPLAGTAATRWSMDAPIAEFLRDGEPHRRRIVARTPGRATVTVAAVGLTTRFELIVVKK